VAPATTTSTPAPPAKPALATVVTLQQPVAMAVRPGDTALYVAEKTGAVRRVAGSAVDPEPVLDLTGRVSRGGEQGLLGIAWSPDGRLLYAHYTNEQGDTRVIELDPATGARRDVLALDQPYPNHNGGQLAFGPDGFLYIGLGDGGSEGDPNRTAQNLGVLLGKVLRIDPHPSPSAAYTIPAGNPLAGRAGARPEIWAYGLRNPWRFSFDRQTGELWIGDVGQDRWEEVDRAAKGRGGQDYGWSRFEGTHPYHGGGSGAAGPAYEYEHVGGACTVIGGYVYRGKALAAALGGKYVFGDYCTGQLSAFDPTTDQARPLGLRVPSLTSFGEDQDGELYALSAAGPVSRLTAQ
jgi:glucose/arabinose dehydrogenase